MHSTASVFQFKFQSAFQSNVQRILAGWLLIAPSLPVQPCLSARPSSAPLAVF